MITVDSGQLQIASRANAFSITLVKLVTYTDYIAGTVDETFYYATIPIRYQWDGATTTIFRAPIKSVSSVSRGFDHIPSTERLSTRDGIEILLDATDNGGEFLWNRITSINIIGADIEVATLLIDLDTPRPDDYQDLSALGAVHTVRFRGRVTNIPEYVDESNVFSLICESPEPVLQWPEALEDTEVSQKDLGKLYPMPVGRPVRVPLVQRQVGWVTTLNSNLTKTTTGSIAVTDATGFPDSPTQFAFMVGTERITAIKVNDNAISIVARATSSGVVGSVAAIHKYGSVMIEETEVAKFVFSGVPALGLTALYARSPHTGELVLIPAGTYGIVSQDESIDPGYKVGLVTFTKQLWASVIQLLNRDANIETQPTASSVESLFITFGAHGQSTDTNALNSGVNILDSSGVAMGYDSGGGTVSTSLWNPTASVPNQTRGVIRARFVIKIRIEGDGSNATVLRGRTVGSPLNITVVNTILRTYNPGSPAQVFETVASAWQTCPANTTLADLVATSRSVSLYLSQATGGTSSTTEVSIDSKASGWEVELDPTVLTETESTGAQEVGFNLDLYADVLGAVALSSEVSEGEFDDDTGWAGFDATITDVGSPGDGFVMTGDGTAVTRVAALTFISPALDFSNDRFKFEYKLTSGSWDILNFGAQAFQIQLLSTAGNFVVWGFPKSVLHGDNLWHEFTLELFGMGIQVISSSGTLDVSGITQINLNWEAQLSANGGSIQFRNLRGEGRSFPEHPMDVAQWVIEDLAGQTTAVDTTTFATAKTNLPGVVVAGDLRNAGATFGDVLGVLGKESRTNFVPSEAVGGTVYKAFNALSTYAFTASARTLLETKGIVARVKKLDDQVNEFIGMYNYRNDLQLGNVEAFLSIIRSNALDNDISAEVATVDITDAQGRVGVMPSDPIGFFLLIDLISVTEIFAYYVHEALRSGLEYSHSVPISSGYDLEAGDIIEFTPRWLSSAVKCRIVRTVRPFDEPMVDLTMEDVL